MCVYIHIHTHIYIYIMCIHILFIFPKEGTVILYSTRGVGASIEVMKKRWTSSKVIFQAGMAGGVFRSMNAGDTETSTWRFHSHGGTPIAGWFIMVLIPFSRMIWGHPYFRKPPGLGLSSRTCGGKSLGSSEMDVNQLLNGRLLSIFTGKNRWNQRN